MGDLWSSANPVLLRGGGGGGSGNEYDNVDGTETIENGREGTRKCGNLGTEYCKREEKMTQ